MVTVHRDNCPTQWRLGLRPMFEDRKRVFVDPGYDPMGAIGQIASGANLLAFTTGRGSCFGASLFR